MILQRANFNVPARFSFQPFAAKWRFANAVLAEWVEDPTLLRPFRFGEAEKSEPEKTWLRVRLGLPGKDDDADHLGGLNGLYSLHPSCTVLMDRTSIPPEVLHAHENHRNTPDLSDKDKWFNVLICQRPEFRDGPWGLRPEEVIKNAWLMSDEFLNLEGDSETDWEVSVWRFLNKWGIWEPSSGFTEDRRANPIQMASLVASLRAQEIDRPDFLLLMPHLLREQQEKYRRAVLPSNARSWLRSHPLSLDTAEDFPFFRVRTNYCREAIEATITIDHLAGIKHGICKRCGNVFEKEKNYRMSYCTRSCANAASVARFREKQRKPKPNWTAAKIAKLLREKGAKRNAES